MPRAWAINGSLPYTARYLNRYPHSKQINQTTHLGWVGGAVGWPWCATSPKLSNCQGQGQVGDPETRYLSTPSAADNDGDEDNDDVTLHPPLLCLLPLLQPIRTVPRPSFARDRPIRRLQWTEWRCWGARRGGTPSRR